MYIYIYIYTHVILLLLLLLLLLLTIIIIATITTETPEALLKAFAAEASTFGVGSEAGGYGHFSYQEFSDPKYLSQNYEITA